MQDFLTASIIAIPTAFALLICIDFITGLRCIFVQTSSSIAHNLPILPETQNCICLSSLDTNVLDSLPDPWTQKTTMMTTTMNAAPKPARTLLLLPPSKGQYHEALPPIKKSKRKTSNATTKGVVPATKAKSKPLINAEFTDSTPAASTPKRGRPCKTV